MLYETFDSDSDSIINNYDAYTGSCLTAPACFTPLHFAAIANHSDIVKILLKHGVNPNLKSFDSKKKNSLRVVDLRFIF